MNNKPPKITLREAAEMAVNVLEGLGYDPIDLQSALADLQSETGFERKEPDSLKAEPVKQEPVADKVLRLLEPFMPVDAKAIRAEALEEAAKECDEWANVKPVSDFSHGSAAGAKNCADAIRGLK